MRPDGLDVLLDPPGSIPTGAGGSAGSAPSIAPIEQTNETFPQAGCGALILGGSHGALAVARSLGRHGKEHVRQHFLTPRYLRDYLRIFGELDGS